MKFPYVFRHSIGWRLITAILAFSGVVTLILTGIQLTRDYLHDVQVIKNRLQQIELSYLDSITNSLWNYDRQSAHLQLEGILHLPDMQYLKISESSNKTFLEVGVPQEEAVIVRHYPLRYTNDQRHSFDLGELVAQASLRSVYEHLLDKAWVIFLSQTLKTFLVSLFIWFLFQYLIGRHLADIADYADTVSADPFKSLNQAVVVQRDFTNPDDEISRLVTALNQMREYLRQAYLEISASEEKFRLAMEITQDALWDWQIGEDHVYYSPGWQHILGCDAVEIEPTYQFWEQHLHPEDRNRTLQALQTALQDSTLRFSVEYRLHSNNAGWKWVLARGQVVETDAEGAALRMIGTLTDITRRKQVEQELAAHRESLEKQVNVRTRELEEAKNQSESANRAKSIFLANMSHELRTPLNAILGFSQMMARESDITPSQRDKLTTINRAGGHLLSMINDVLDLSKIEAGKTELKPECFDLEQMFQDIAEMFRFSARDKGLAFHLELDGRLSCHVESDPGKLRQVLINLLGNAFKFTHEGAVTLRAGYETAANDGGILRVEVEDSGPGIPAAELDKIFEPFSQATSSSHSDHKGTGLGLAISRSFIALLKGKMTAKSTLGQGACFCFEIPLAFCEEQTAAATNQSEVISLEAGQAEQRVLVVDDDTDNCALLSQLLEPVGFKVREAHDGAQAVELFQTWSPHFIWLDIRMPVMDGYEAARRIRALPSGDTVKIVAVTASVFIDQEKDVLAAGCDHVVRKPYQSREIFTVLENYLGVRYVYAQTLDSQPPTPTLSPLRAEDLARMPHVLLKALLNAVLELDVKKIAELAEQIGEHETALAEAVQTLSKRYRYSELMELCQQALNHLPEQENGNEQ